MNRFPIILLFLLYPYLLNAQSDSILKSYKTIGFRFHKGFIIPHSESIRSISFSKPWIVEGDFSWHFNTMKAWSYCSCFPRLGLSAMYVNFDNPDILGHAFTLSPYVEPFFSAHRKFSSSFRFAAGVAYLNNIFDPVTNPLNLFYSTHFSFLLTASFNLQYRITDTWSANLRGAYNHISNGGNKEPNKGINFPTLSAGFDYSLTPVRFKEKRYAIKDTVKNKSEIKISILGTAKKPFPGEDKRYMVLGLSVNYSYLAGRISAISIGAEIINDLSVRESLQRESGPYRDHKRVGLLAGHELRIGRFRCSQQLGIYVYAPTKARDAVYQRWGLEFLPTKWLFTGINLKSHRHVADFMDIRVGVIMP